MSVRDPRLMQLAVLLTLLAGAAWTGLLCIPVWQAPVHLLTALGVQWACGRWVGVRFDWRSPAITALGTTLLLRTASPLVSALCVAVAIASKFAIRVRGKHVFNPGNLGIVVAVGLTGQAWISPGQWGNVAWFGLLTACVGLLVVTRSERADVTLAFLGGWGGFLLTRCLWLGDPMSIPLHQLRSGALLLFAFFMISDPKTTPDARPARIAWGIAVALLGAALQFGWYTEVGPIWALVCLAPVVPLLDRWFPGRSHHWSVDASARPAGAVRPAAVAV